MTDKKKVKMSLKIFHNDQWSTTVTAIFYKCIFRKSVIKMKFK